MLVRFIEALVIVTTELLLKNVRQDAVFASDFEC